MRKQKYETTKDFESRLNLKLQKVTKKKSLSLNPKKNPNINTAHFPSDPDNSVYILKNWSKFAKREKLWNGDTFKYVYKAKKNRKEIWNRRIK